MQVNIIAEVDAGRPFVHIPWRKPSKHGEAILMRNTYEERVTLRVNDVNYRMRREAERKGLPVQFSFVAHRHHLDDAWLAIRQDAPLARVVKPHLREGKLICAGPNQVTHCRTCGQVLPSPDHGA